MNPLAMIHTPEYEPILTARPDLGEILTRTERSEAKDAFVIVCGKGAVGKTAITHRLAERFPRQFQQHPEVMTREPRPGEVVGVDLIRYSDSQFDDALRHGNEFLFALHNRVRDKRAALRIETIGQAVDAYRRYGQRAVLIMAAPAYFILKHLFPGTQLYVITARPKEHRLNQIERDLSSEDSASQCIYGVTYPGFEVAGAIQVALIWAKCSNQATRA
jgi:guanylate kinase